jgi:hypothetical protein
MARNPRRKRPRLLVGAVILVLGLGLLPWFGRGPARAFVSDTLGVQRVEALGSSIDAAAAEAGVDPCLVAAICFMESRGRVDAVSSADALGLMQLKVSSASDAAKRVGIEVPTREQLLSDSDLNLRLGANHLRWLLDHRGGWDMEQILVAYNAGRARLFAWIDDLGSWEAWRTREERRMRRGEANTGCLAYARRVLTMRDHFCERGRVGGR